MAAPRLLRQRRRPLLAPPSPAPLWLGLGLCAPGRLSAAPCRPPRRRRRRRRRPPPPVPRRAPGPRPAAPRPPLPPPRPHLPAPLQASPAGVVYLLPDCNLSPSGTFAPGAPDSLPCSAAESSGSGTPGTAETRPSLLPSSQNYCRLIPSAPFPHTLLLFPCKADLRCLSVLPFCRAAVGHPKTLLQGA